MINAAQKWYRELDFPLELDGEFYTILERVKNIDVPSDKAKSFLLEKKDYGLSLVYFLSLCDRVRENFIERGIEEKYFRELITIIREEALDTKRVFGQLGIYEVGWVNFSLSKDSLFRIGCLDFEVYKTSHYFPLELPEGERALSVHIPATRRLDIDACLEAMEEAKSFFAKYFPEYRFEKFVCYSWLLWRGLENFLGPDSNILSFGRLFELEFEKEQDDAIVFVISKLAKKENIAEFEVKTTLQKKLKEHVLGGGKLFVGAGIRKF